MMLNISYNMNNNIDANSAAHFVFHQPPPALASAGGVGGAPQSQNESQLALVHHPLTN